MSLFGSLDDGQAPSASSPPRPLVHRVLNDEHKGVGFARSGSWIMADFSFPHALPRAHVLCRAAITPQELRPRVWGQALCNYIVGVGYFWQQYKGYHTMFFAGYDFAAQQQ